MQIKYLIFKWQFSLAAKRKQLIHRGLRVSRKKNSKKIKKIFGEKFWMYICSPFGGERAISSVGLEHLPYKQGVVGSNPTSPTKMKRLSNTTVFFF